MATPLLIVQPVNLQKSFSEIRHIFQKTRRAALQQAIKLYGMFLKNIINTIRLNRRITQIHVFIYQNSCFYEITLQHLNGNISGK